MENPYRLYQQLLSTLSPRYDAGEARAVALWVLSAAFGWQPTEVYIGKDREFSADDAARFRQICSRLAEGEPVQYVLGFAEFLGLRYAVRPGVLIPRPETEDLVGWVADDLQAFPAPRIVDCGTGSGCIAISLARMVPAARVEGWDTSDEALTVARENALRLAADVRFLHCDMATLAEQSSRFDVCVSNPPYVLQSERTSMASWVKDYEPAAALFVADADPLVHYRHLADSGLPLYVEINASQTEALCRLLADAGYRDTTVRRDRFGRNRMIRARR